MLPGIDGIEVCKRLRLKSDRIGIIMLTARTQEADKINGLSSGADDYMTKPFSPPSLWRGSIPSAEEWGGQRQKRLRRTAFLTGATPSTYAKMP